MQPHEARVVEEQKALEDKLVKLGGFIGGEVFNKLAKEDKGLLQEQMQHMSAYSGVLRERIKRFMA